MGKTELELVNQDEAAMLKSMGFDWPTLHLLNPTKKKGAIESKGKFPVNWNKTINCLCRPSLDLAFKWLRQQKRIFVTIDHAYSLGHAEDHFYVGNICAFIPESVSGMQYWTNDGGTAIAHSTYEQAQHEALERIAKMQKIKEA